MYFRRLEIFGFKSFADKTKIEFEPGVTVIVGHSRRFDAPSGSIHAGRLSPGRGGMLDPTIIPSFAVTNSIQLYDV